MRSIAYHKAAVKYNEEFAEAAQKIAVNTKYPVTKKWALAEARKHDSHAHFHRQALKKIQEIEEADKAVAQEETSDE